MLLERERGHVVDFELSGRAGGSRLGRREERVEIDIPVRLASRLASRSKLWLAKAAWILLNKVGKRGTRLGRGEGETRNQRT